MNNTRPPGLQPMTDRGFEYWIWEVPPDDPDEYCSHWVGEIGAAQYVGDREMVEECILGAIRDMVEMQNERV